MSSTLESLRIACRTTFVAFGLGALLSLAIAQAPCTLDSDCDDGQPCNGLESCGIDNTCRNGAPRCANLSLQPGVAASASSEFSTSYTVDLAIDGTNSTVSSWCTANNDPQPLISLAFPTPVEVARIQIVTPWSPTYDFLTGIFRILDGGGGELFNSGVVTLTSGAIDYAVEPPIPGAVTVEFEGVTWTSIEPCLGELEVYGLETACVTDAECDDGLTCNGIEFCNTGGYCAGGAARCDNLSLSSGVSASSDLGAGWAPELAIDGVNANGSSWCTANNDPVPNLTITLPGEVTVETLRILTSWSPTYDFLTGTFELYDDAGGLRYDSGVVDLVNGEIDLSPSQSVTSTRRVEFDGVTWNSIEPCLSEFEVLVEQCGLSLHDDTPDTIYFRPGQPEPQFEIRYGSVADLSTDGFTTSTCLGQYTGGPAVSPLADPAPGNARYFIARGLNVCLDQGWGYNYRNTTRSDLLALPTCPP